LMAMVSVLKLCTQARLFCMMYVSGAAAASKQ
jgi:hypothetical protein